MTLEDKDIEFWKSKIGCYVYLMSMRGINFVLGILQAFSEGQRLTTIMFI
jgi:hypothetical protein